VTLVFFYVSPVFYSVDLVPENIRTVYLLNPLASLIKLFHDALYWGKMPDLTVLLLLAGVALLVGLVGYAVFNRRKREFAEIV
jgi:ABC-type polysaccharide/polyol phosphate export permease